MNAYKNMREFAKGYSIPGANIEATFKACAEIAEKQSRDPEDGPHEAYGGGKCCDA